MLKGRGIFFFEGAWIDGGCKLRINIFFIRESTLTERDVNKTANQQTNKKVPKKNCFPT